MSEPVVEPETAIERFARLYGTPERGARLWSQWMESQTETTRGVMENVAGTVAEERGISLEDARTFLAIQKLIEDRGVKFVEKFLKEHDAAAMSAGRTLRPMASAKPRR